MQQITPSPSISASSMSISRIFSTCLCLLLLVTNTLAASLPASDLEITPALQIRPVLQGRAQTVNLTAYFVQACGEDYVDCGNQRCCRGGQECLVGTQTSSAYCGTLSTNTTSTPSPTSTPSSSSGSKAPIGAIVGGVIGGVAVVALLCIYCLIHHRRNHTKAPSVPQPPILNLPNVIEAKYLPANESSPSSWQPGSLLYHHNRNRSGSTASCVSPDGYTPACEANIGKYGQHLEAPKIMELPATSPTVELQGDDGYFAIKPQPPPPPPPPPPLVSPTTTVASPTTSRRMSFRSPTEFKQYWKKSPGN